MKKSLPGVLFAEVKEGDIIIPAGGLKSEEKPVEEGEVIVVAEHKKPPKNSRPMLGPAFDQKP